MDSLYNLAVRLELSAGGMMQAAEGAIATFGRIEASAGRMERAVRGMRLTLDTQGLQASAQEAMGVFRTLEMQGGKTGEAFRAMGLSSGLSPLLQDYRAATTELGAMETAATAAEAKAKALSETLTRAEYVSRAGIPGAVNPVGGVFADTSTNRSYAYTRAQAVAADAEANALRYTHLPVAAVAEANAGYALQTQLATQTKMLDDKAAADEARAKRSQGLLMGGAVMAGAGFMGLGVIKGWVKDAEGMQDALAKVSLATTGTSAQLAALQSQSYTVAGQTQYSAPQIMDMEAKMGRMGINRRDWVAQDIPTIARAAEIDQRMAGISPDASVPAMISQAHMLGATHGKAFIDNIALGTRALLASGMTPEEQNTTLKYLLPAKNATGMTNAEMFQWASLSNLMGLSQGKGGSYTAAMFSGLVPGVGTKKHLEALARLDKLGGGHIYEHGNMVDSARVQQIISRAIAAEPTDAEKQSLAFYAFGKQGERAAFALTSPVAMASSDMLRKKLAPYDPVKNPTGIATVEEMQKKLNETMVGQTNTLNTNLHSLSAMLGDVLIPSLTQAAHALVQLTGGMIAFGQQHPLLTKLAAGAMLVGTAFSLIVGPIMIALGTIALIGPAFGALGTAAAFVADIGLAPLLLFGAALAGTVFIITHWSETVRFVGGVFSALGAGLHGMIDWMRSHIPGFAGATDALSGHDDRHRPLLNSYTAHGLQVPNSRGDVDTAGSALVAMYTAASRTSGVPLNVLLAQGARESDFHNVAQKGGGGLGLAQWDFSTATNAKNAMHYLHAASVAQAKLYAMDPARAIMGQAAYDADLRRQHGGTWQGALAAYNGSGPAADKYGAQVWAAAGRIKAAPPARGGHQIVVHAPISIHPAPGEHPQATTKKLADHIKSTLHAELDGAIRNAQGHGGLDLNGHYA